ncbi:MAG: Lin1244/Lin1753 domain-containing protein [Bacteroidales bacterium]
MSKDAFWFSHDSNARNDEKIIALRMRHQMEGYGIYFAIIERLRESDSYMCVKDYNIIAFDLRVAAEKVKSIVEDFNLFEFTEDNKYFFSERLIRSMAPFENLSQQRRLAGKKSAEKRWGKSEETDENQRPLKESLTTVKEKSNLYNIDILNKKNIKEINKENFDFDFLKSNPEFLTPLKKWIDYKKEIKSEITSQIQIEIFYKELFSESNGSISAAEKLINWNISKGYKNLYLPEKQQTNGKSSDLRSSERAKQEGGYGQL